MNGKLIVLEGIDGTGKTSQIQVVMDWLNLNNIPAISVREPGGTKLGEKLRDILINDEMCSYTELMVFFAARNELLSNVIIPNLESGNTVVMDRFFYSSIAYQIAGRKLVSSSIKKLIEYLIECGNYRLPDLTLYLDADVEVAKSRMSDRVADKFEKLDSDFHHRVLGMYRTLTKSHLEMVTINANEPISHVSLAIIHELTKLFKETKDV